MAKFNKKKSALLVFLLLIVLSSCLKSRLYQTGVYEDEEEGRNGPIRISVSIDSNGKIQRIDVLNHNETKEIMENVSTKISKEIIRNQTANVDTLSGATQTSWAYIEAVRKALEQAE